VGCSNEVVIKVEMQQDRGRPRKEDDGNPHSGGGGGLVGPPRLRKGTLRSHDCSLSTAFFGGYRKEDAKYNTKMVSKCEESDSFLPLSLFAASSHLTGGFRQAQVDLVEAARLLGNVPSACTPRQYSSQ